MGAAPFVQAQVARLDSIADPGAATVATRAGAGCHDFGKGSIAGNPEAIPPDRLGQRPGQMKCVQRQNRTAARLDPEDLGVVTRICHRKNSAAVRQYQQVGIDDSRRLGHGKADNTAKQVSGSDKSMLAKPDQDY